MTPFLSYLRGLRYYREKVLLIESLERIFESNSVETIIQFLTTIAEDDTWRIVATCRIHSLDMACHHLLYPSRIHNLKTLTIPPLDADDFGKVLSPDTEHCTSRDKRPCS